MAHAHDDLRSRTRALLFVAVDGIIAATLDSK